MVITTDQPQSQALNKGIHPPGFLQKIFTNIQLQCFVMCGFDIFKHFTCLPIGSLDGWFYSRGTRKCKREQLV